MMNLGRFGSPLIIRGRCPFVQNLLSFELTSGHLRNPCDKCGPLTRVFRGPRENRPSRRQGLMNWVQSAVHCLVHLMQVLSKFFCIASKFFIVVSQRICKSKSLASKSRDFEARHPRYTFGRSATEGIGQSRIGSRSRKRPPYQVVRLVTSSDLRCVVSFLRSRPARPKSPSRPSQPQSV